ncbi:MAG: hypothetical protein WEG40_16465 [Candidatus Rokuibacteriota bacterium]
MLRDPMVWLFGLALGLVLAGVLGVALSVRRVRPGKPLEVAGTVIALGSEPGVVSELHAEVTRLEADRDAIRAERDELRTVLKRLAALLNRPRPQPPADRTAGLVTSIPAGRNGEQRAGDGGG